MEEIKEYYGVEITLVGFHYSTKKEYTDKYLYLKHKNKRKRFRTKEEMIKYIENFK